MEVKKEMENNPINMKIYFAYGSNLHLEQMKQRCPTAKLLGTGRIENYTLLFRGPCQEDTFLTVEPKQGSFVPVAASRSNLRTSKLWTIMRMSKTISTASKLFPPKSPVTACFPAFGIS